jgi:nucleoside-diphosphate-sugar epimerase
MAKQRIATVIGARGVIGTALVRHLQATDWDCRTPPRDAVWPEMQAPLGVVFYCAGMTADYLAQPALTLEAHVGLLARVLQSRSYSALVYLSSTRLYDALPSDFLAMEDTSLPVRSTQPRHLYDITKLAGESLCFALGQGKARVARLACVYDRADTQGFLPQLLDQVMQARAGDTLTVQSSAHYARDYVHLSDVIRLLVAIGTTATQPIYNVASGINLSNAQLAQWVEEYSGRRIAFQQEIQPTAPARVDIQRSCAEFGWTPLQAHPLLRQWLQTIDVPGQHHATHQP